MLDLRWMNGAPFIHRGGYSNHRSSPDLVELFEYVAAVAPGSYGLLHVHDDEEPGHENDVRVLTRCLDWPGHEESGTALDQGPARGQTALHEISRHGHQGADREPAMSASLPFFRYHPDPLASGSIRAASETCACCKGNRGWIYTATFYTAQDVSGRLCPWCIADGSAAERFAGEFTDAYGLDGVSEEVLHEVTRRTPGFHAWQDPHWLVHCQDAAAFVGEVGYAELAAHPEALDQLRADMRTAGWHDESQLEHFLVNLGEGATAMLFRCTVCGTYLAYADAS
ncbi:CbrC family protein [Streptomyces olivaceoviridis]